jgi:hypothetical protein
MTAQKKTIKDGCFALRSKRVEFLAGDHMSLVVPRNPPTKGDFKTLLSQQSNNAVKCLERLRKMIALTVVKPRLRANIGTVQATPTPGTSKDADCQQQVTS